MTKNVGSIDRIVRIVSGIAMIALGFYFHSWLGAIGLIPLLTGLAQRCPAYCAMGVSTCNK